MVYARVISDANGNFRFDENLVANIPLTSWLKLESGIRQGERPQQFDSYFHYKLELQTKWLDKKLRLIGRLSDNVISYPSPSLARTNYLLIAESKWPLYGSFSLLLAGGYDFTFQKDRSSDKFPILGNGVQDNFPVYKVALHYKLHRGSAEAVWGSYDVFNPYLLTAPFFQLTFEHELSERFDLYSYFRYQYDHSPEKPLNDFLGFGIKLSLGK